MTYIVLETQTNDNVTTIAPAYTTSDRNAAENKFHTILAYAATSQVEEHAAMLLTHDGRMLRNECYRHPKPEPVEEPEEEEEVIPE